MRDYILVSADSGEALSVKVREKILEGYSLHDGVNVKTTHLGQTFFYQALVKYWPM